MVSVDTGACPGRQAGWPGLFMEAVGNIRTWHIACAAAVIYALTLTPVLSSNGDDATYIVMSRTILQKGLFSYLAVPEYGIYNFLLSFFLLPFSAFAPDAFLYMKIIPVVSAVLAVGAVGAFLKGMAPDGIRKMALILFAVNPWTVRYAALILTEMPYVLFSFCALLALHRYDERPGFRYAAAAFVCIAASIYLRPMGLAFIPAVMAWLAFQRRWRELAAAIVCSVAILLPLCKGGAYIAAIVIGGSIVKQDAFAAGYVPVSAGTWLYRACYETLVYIGNYIPDILLRPLVEQIYPRSPTGGINPAFIPKFCIGVSAFAVAAAGVFGRKGRMRPHHWYLIFYGGALATINVYVARYLVPVIPFLLFGLLAGIGMAGRRSPRIATGILCAVFAALVAVSVAGSAAEIRDARTGIELPGWQEFVSCNDWLKRAAPGADPALSRKPAYTTLMTGHQGVAYSFSEDPEEQLRHIRKNGIAYIIISADPLAHQSVRAVDEMIRKYPARFIRVYSVPGPHGCDVYQVVK